MKCLLSFCAKPQELGHFCPEHRTRWVHSPEAKRQALGDFIRRLEAELLHGMKPK